ncbi:MAG: glucuronate isomerase [Ignavibacteriales bacterium]|nr:glucuronate isomerase [Ignavibacteriales bacterium]
MINEFITENFLLSNKTAIELFHQYAKDQPIIDYHCHVPPKEIAEDRRFANMTQIWLAGDHYKWRAMRANGINERLITGDASDKEKFLAWAQTVPKTIRNPLYHWTHMELKKPFGISDILLNENTANDVWKRCNARLSENDFTTRGIIKQMNVKLICTTDDPIDSLEYHQKLKNDKSFPVLILPAFRADKAMNIEQGKSFIAYIEKLGEVSDIQISSYQNLIEALKKRHAFFHSQGCRLSDHGLETVYVENFNEKEIETIFSHALSVATLDQSSILKFKSAILLDLCMMDHSAEWTQQFHLGAMRNTNPKMFRQLGPDTGYDSIGDFSIAQPLARLFGKLADRDALTKTIIYNLNPADNEIFATMIGNFQDGNIPGKIQFGSGWWFLDQKDGIERQLNALSNMGLLSRFVGMLTDSRSFLSYPRHEYFRRILCNILGTEIENGLIPNDINLIGGMVKDICYNNAHSYFNFFSDEK